MNKQEAREKFGQYTEDEDGNERWEIDKKKLRGMMLKYSREQNYLEGTAEWPDPEEWITHFWSWVKAKIGVGYKGIIQDEGASPSGRFDRLSKSEAIGVATSYYENHHEFAENMDGAWEQVDKTDALPKDNDVYVEVLENMDSGEIINMFFNIYDGHDNIGPGERQGPNVRAYKYNMKQWAFECETIQSDADALTAESFVAEWVDWMAEEILASEAPLVDMEPEKSVGGSGIPSIDEVEGWCRELWSDSERFHECVKSKWNKEIESDDVESPDASDMGDIRDGIDTTSRDKSGQQGLADFTG